MGRRAEKIDPTACEHLVERLRHGRRRFHRDHQPTLVTWLYMHQRAYERQLDGMIRDGADRKSEQGQRYADWLRLIIKHLTYLISNVPESWGRGDWELARSTLWERTDTTPVPSEEELARLKDDGNPNGD